MRVDKACCWGSPTSPRRLRSPPAATRVGLLPELPVNGVRRLSRRKCPLVADIVAKTILRLKARKIDSRSGASPHVDSKIHPPRFDRCEFVFYSYFVATFATEQTL